MTTTRSKAIRTLLTLLAVLGFLFAVRALAPPDSIPWLDYPVLSVYVLVLLVHKSGIPAVLEHDGLCGWGMCSPTPLGWTIGVVIWLCLLALISWIIALVWSWLASRRT